jgi:tetratricopeptide (TPR) repeat protein
MTWDFDGAEKEFRKAIALDPTDAFAHRGLGRIRQQQKEYDAALSEFREAEKLDETSPESYRGAGSVLIAMQDYSRAAKELKQAENLNPGDPVVHDLYGQALSGMGDNKGAVVEFKQALALNPKQPQVMLELASSLEKTGDWVASLGEYHQAALADHEPGTGTQDRYKTAQERFKQHIAALRASGKSAEATALEDSLRASNANPGLSQRLDEALLKAEGEVKDQRFDEAGRDYKDAVELAGKVQPVDDRLVTALLGVSNFYGRENDFVHVEASLQRALEVTQELHGAESPEMTRPLQILGSYFLYRHDADTAFKYFSRAVEVNEKIFGEGSDKVALSLVYLSTVFTVQQDYAKAEPYLLRAAQIEETYYAAGGVGMDMVLASLCDLYTKWNKPEKADPRYRQTIALLEKEFGPDSPVLLSTLSEEAETLRKLGRTDEAEKFERRAQVIREATGQTDSQPFPEPPK